MRETLCQQVAKIDNFGARSHGKQTWHIEEICSNELKWTRHPERSEAESKDPVALRFRIPTRFLDFARNDEAYSVPFPPLLLADQ